MMIKKLSFVGKKRKGMWQAITSRKITRMIKE